MIRPGRGLALAALIAASPAVAAPSTADDAALLDRLSWGANGSDAATLAQQGANHWLDTQLRMGVAPLPPAAATQVEALRSSRTDMATLVVAHDAANRAANALPDPDARRAAHDAANRTLADLGREAQTRSLLRDLYAPDQLREQLTWFWFNHFNVQMNKRDIRAMVGDYEQVLRVHALGRFRDLLAASLTHPAMLRYLDNDQNAAGHLNENYARELMELHTLGVGGGYTQADVEALARILTGVGIDLHPDPPRLRADQRALLVRAGLFEFNPARHDFGAKRLLGHDIAGRGWPEVEQALDLLAAAPATARHVSTQLATFFTGTTPPPALVERMVAAWRHSDGDVAAVVRAMVRAPEFRASLGHGFKDPLHWAVSAVRLAYDGRVIANPQPIAGWVNRLGEGLFAHETPDGYPLTGDAWSGPGQLETRFELARAIGAGPAGLFRGDGQAADAPAFPQIQQPFFFVAIAPRLAAPTRAALAQAPSPQAWTALFLSSPDFMHR